MSGILRYVRDVRKMLGPSDRNGVCGDITLLPLSRVIELRWDGTKMGRRGITLHLSREQAVTLSVELAEMVDRMTPKGSTL